MRRGMIAWAWLGLAVAVVDQLTKAWVERVLVLGERVDVLPFFAWVHVRNEGAAFSLLADASGWQRWLFAALALGFSVWLLWELTRLRRHERWLACGYALVLGGALGNLADRLVQGSVTDFLLFHWRGAYFPAFNLADSAITIGAVIWIGSALLYSAAGEEPVEQVEADRRGGDHGGKPARRRGEAR